MLVSFPLVEFELRMLIVLCSEEMDRIGYFSVDWENLCCLRNKLIALKNKVNRGVFG